MTPERWQQIQDLFYQADELPQTAQAAFLNKRCNGDTELRREVEQLLAAAYEDLGQIEHCVGRAAEEMLSEEMHLDKQAPLIERIGPWQIVRPLGEGGMGVVYLAQRADDEYRQQVAIKVVRPSLGSRSAWSRFRSERQILANLSHVNIARLLDGGMTAERQPFFVMEYIEGKPIDVWCRERGVTLRRKLELFRAVCDGVQCAHQNLVVHRDIKPGNILVTPDGTPKLLDFGIAKMLDAQAIESDDPRTRYTDQMMTPEYASPEQILGQPATTATDVYGLGVLLYELLSGKRPFAIATCTPGEIERVICQSEAPKPSVAARAAANARDLPAALEGDLDNIVLKAMHKEAIRRYSSAAELSEDVRRHLEGFPVIARPDEVWYRAARFAARHRGAVIAASFFVILIIGFGIGMAILARRAESQRDRAEQTSSFLVSLFSAADPDQPARNDFTAREMLDRGIRQVDHLSSQPALQSSLLDTFGLVYENLGSWPESRKLLRRSLEIKRRLYSAGSLEIAANLKNLAELARRSKDYPEAEEMVRESIAIRTERLGERDVLTAESKNTLALVMHETGRLREAERLFLEVLSLRENLRTRTHLDTAILSNLGALYGDIGDGQSAEKYLRECIEIRRKELGPAHPRLALAMSKLALVLESGGKLSEAEVIMREGLAIRQKTLGLKHPDVPRSLVHISGILRKQGRLEASREALKEAGKLYEHISSDPDGVVNLQYQEALLLEAEGRLVDAERALRMVLQTRRSRMPDTHITVARTMASLAGLLSKSGRNAEARTLLQSALPVLSARLPERHPERLQAVVLLAALPPSQK